MAQLSPQQPPPPPQAQPKTEVDAEAEDLALADSFFNYDYVPDMSPQHNGPQPDPICFGSESNRVEELPEAEAEAEAEGVVNLGVGGGIEEGIEKISLVVVGGSGDVDDDKGHQSDGSDESKSDGSGDGKEEKRDGDEEGELEEGEIVESDDDDFDGSNDDDDEPIRSKNELEILPSVPPVNVTLEPHHRMLPVGHITSVDGDQVIVEGVEDHEPLNEGSVLWITERRKLLGLIDEIFGQVKNPYYVVRYNSVSEVPEGIHGGTSVSFVAEFANHVLNNNKDLYEKGYDYDEEASEPEFSDDEKEAEYQRKQRMAKRKSKGKMFSPKVSVASAAPAPFHDHGSCATFSGNGQVPSGARIVAPAASSNDHGHCSSFSGNGQVPFGATAVAPAALLGNGQGHFGARIVAPAAPFHGQGQSSTFSGNGQGPFGAPTVVPSFPLANAGPNLNAAAVWQNGAALPQPPMLPNGYPTNGIPWFPGNTQISPQFPLPGVPFQQLLNPNQVFGLAMFPAQPVYAQGLGVQNQMAFGSSSPFLQVQPPVFPGQQQGFPSSEFHPETNPNLASGSIIPFNHQAPLQFHPGTSSNHGRNFHPRGRKGWRPAR